jgi:hypothetical protein
MSYNMDEWELKTGFISALLNQKGYTLVGSGSTRDAYLSKCGKWVVKVPRDPVFQAENQSEAVTFRMSYHGINPFNDICYAKCRLFTFHGVDLVIMEAVEIIEHPAWHEAPLDLPEWVDWLDARQAGYNRRGELVAYDYA